MVLPRVFPALAAGTLLSLVAATTAAAQQYEVSGGTVRITVPLKPGGAFEAKTTTLAGTLTMGAPGKPQAVTGELSIDLRTIDTGIALRNEHLRDKYLEVSKGQGYDRAVLSNIALTDADSPSFRGSIGFKGNLTLHNTQTQVEGKSEIRDEGADVRVEASFLLTLTDFGVTPPEYMGVGVGSRLLVKVAFTAHPAKAR